MERLIISARNFRMFFHSQNFQQSQLDVEEMAAGFNCFGTFCKCGISWLNVQFLPLICPPVTYCYYGLGLANFICCSTILSI